MRIHQQRCNGSDRRRMGALSRRRVSLVTLLATAVWPALAITPTFEKIVRSGDSVPGRESLNVVFNGRAFQANETPGVLSRPTINENGDVAFYGRSSDPSNFNLNAAIGLYAKPAGQPLVRIVDTSQAFDVIVDGDVANPVPFNFSNFDPPLLNNAGQVVFYATYSGGSGFFAADIVGGPIVQIVANNDEVPGFPGTTFSFGFKFGGSFARFTLISLNDAGQVVFMGGFQRSGAPFTDFGYYGSTVAGGSLVQLADTTGTVQPADQSIPFRSLSQSELPALNNNGIVVFEGAIGSTAANVIQGVWTIPVDGSAGATTRALRGQVVTVSDGSQQNLNTSFGGHDLSDAGEFTFQHAFGNSSTSLNAIFAGNLVNPSQSGLTSVVDGSGGLAVPARSGADYRLIQFGPLNEFGQTIFHGTDSGTTTSNSSGAYFGTTAGDSPLLVANNEQVPPGRSAPAIFNAMNDPRSVRIDLNDSGNAVLELPATNEANNDAVFGLYFWEACSESLQLIVDADSAAAPLPNGLGGTFAAPGCAGSPCERAMTINRSIAHRNGHYSAMNNNNDVAFLTAFSTFDVGIYVASIDAGAGDLTITCPADVTLECPADTTPANTGEATAEGCGTITITFSDNVIADCGGTQTIERTWTADNGGGSPASCVQTITVVDTTAPTLTCPADLTVECDQMTNDADFAAWLASAVAADDCGNATVTTDVTALPAGCGATVVTFTATDECGNVAMCTATFTVEDTIDPMLTCPADQTVECDGAGNQAELDAWLDGAAASDECGDVTVTNDFTGLVAACGATGSATVTWTATDPCGNTALCSATFTIADTTAPALAAPADLTVGIDPGVCTASNVDLGTPTSGDACGGVTVTNDAPMTFALGDTIVTWTATDDCGNVATATQTVTVENLAPTAEVNITQLTNIGAVAQVRFDGSASSDPEGPNSELDFTWTVDGNVECSGTGGSCEVIELGLDYGMHTVTLRVTDRCGEFSEVTTDLMVDPAELSVLEVARTVVRFCANPPRATIRGRVGLPLGVDHTEVAPLANVNVAIGGVEILAPTDVNFTSQGPDGRFWRFRDQQAQLGINRFNINWRGNSYRFRESGFPIDLRSDVITTTETLLEVRARRRNQIPGPFTIDIDGQAMVGFDEDFNVVAANVPYDVEVVGKRVVLTLPFPLTENSVINFGGSLPRTINVVDDLTASLGRFTMKVKFDETLLPDGAMTMPVQIDLGMTIGNEGYPGDAVCGPDQFIVTECHWRTWDCDEDDDDD